MTLWKWSQTAADNDDADSTINLRENQAPSTYNNSVRAVMTAVRKWWDDMSGNLVLGGTSTAYTVTTNQVITTLGATTDGFSFSARINATSGANPTLAVDGLTAKQIRGVKGTNVVTGLLLINSIQTFTYDSTDDAWIVHGANGVSSGALVSRPFVAGFRQLFFNTSAPTGWTKDTALNNGAIRMVSGTVDSDGGSQDFTTVFASRTITQANLPIVNLSTASITFSPTTIVTNVSAATSQAQTAGGAPVTVVTSVTPTTAAPVFGGSVPLGGSGTAMSWAVKYANAIRATID